jgi:hypothetical protein
VRRRRNATREPRDIHNTSLLNNLAEQTLGSIYENPLWTLTRRKIMKGLPTSSTSSSCFGNCTRKRGSILTRVRRIFKGPPRATEYLSQHEKPYRHVPTHAASDFIRSTTTPAMRRAEAAAQVQPSTIDIPMEEG